MDKTGSDSNKTSFSNHLWEDLYYIKEELKNNDFIGAYNRIQRLRKNISSLPHEKQLMEIKNELRKLNNGLNTNLLLYISKNK